MLAKHPARMQAPWNGQIVYCPACENAEVTVCGFCGVLASEHPNADCDTPVDVTDQPLCDECQRAADYDPADREPTEEELWAARGWPGGRV